MERKRGCPKRVASFFYSGIKLKSGAGTTGFEPATGVVSMGVL